MKIAICEDDEKDVELLVLHIKAYGGNNFLETFSSVDALHAAYAAGNRYDLIFMDINVNGKNGFAAAQELKRAYPQMRPLIVFTTVSTEHSVFGYSFAFDYILKPVDKNYIMQVLLRAGKKLNPAVISIKKGNANQMVVVTDIMYAEISNMTLSVTLKDSKQLKTRMSIESFFSMLPNGMFVKPHKSYIVAFSYVAYYDASVVRMKDDKELEVSRNFRKAFEAGMEAYLRGDYNE